MLGTVFLNIPENRQFFGTLYLFVKVSLTAIDLFQDIIDNKRIRIDRIHVSEGEGL